MPKKLSAAATLPTLVQERLAVWGKSIHAQRMRQRMTAADLCERMGISDATLRRVERGDVGAAAGTYLSALLILGLIDEAAPTLPASLWSAAPQRRVRLRRPERGGNDGDYF